MPERPLLLKLLLRERHWQHYGTFCAEYDKAAARIDPDLAGSVPSRAQLHRWLTGSTAPSRSRSTTSASAASSPPP